MLKRSAGAAGAAAIATPVVQVIGIGRSSAQEPSVPPPTEPPGECQAISNLQIIVLKNGTYYGLKWDPEENPGFNDWSDAAPNSNDCLQYWVGETGNTIVASQDVADDFNELPVVVDMISDCTWRMRLPLPSGYTYVVGFMKFGNTTDHECPLSGQPNGSYIEFTTV